MNKPKLSEKKMLSVNFTEIREEIYFIEYILTNFILYVRRNFKNVTIELAIHSHSAPIFRLRNISISRKKNPSFT